MTAEFSPFAKANFCSFRSMQSMSEAQFYPLKLTQLRFILWKSVLFDSQNYLGCNCNNNIYDVTQTFFFGVKHWYSRDNLCLSPSHACIIYIEWYIAQFENLIKFIVCEFSCNILCYFFPPTPPQHLTKFDARRKLLQN